MKKYSLAALLFCTFSLPCLAAPPLVAHVFVALTDNVYQGIVPVPAFLGNGDDTKQNLYWGAGYGMKTFFSKKSPNWKLESCRAPISSIILERCVFSSTKGAATYLVADAYRGREINAAMVAFMSSAAGKLPLHESFTDKGAKTVTIDAPHSAELSVYVGHNALMDASSASAVSQFASGNKEGRQAAVLACKSQSYFAGYIDQTGAQNFVTTYDFMAPEAYVVEGLVEAWRQGGSSDQARIQAARAYAKYQKISEKTARRMFGAPKL